MRLAWFLTCILSAGCILDSAGTVDVTAATGGSSASPGAGGATASTATATAAGGMSSTTGGGAGGTTGSGEGGEGGADCGDGMIDAGESCDDMNTTPNDGCTTCEVDAGYECDGTPSQCDEIAPREVDSGAGLGAGIADDESYDGTITTMTCISLGVADEGYTAIQRVEVTVGVEHNYLGDLVFKLISPSDTVLTLMSRPGHDEPVDTADGTSGDSSNLRASDPITFADDASTDAEQMGAGIGALAEACQDDGLCDYFPNPGAGPGTALSDFAGENPVGTWQFCAADADTGDSGTIDRVILRVLAW